MQIAVLEGYNKTPKTRRRARGGGRSNFAAAGRACAREGNRPGTKSFGACMRRRLKK